MNTDAQEFLGSIIEKASNDANFKSDLISNPKAAIEGLKGGTLNIPAGKEIVVVDQTNSDKIYINIPQSVEDMELSDEQLEMVSGGIFGLVTQLVVAPWIYKWWNS